MQIGAAWCKLKISFRHFDYDSGDSSSSHPLFILHSFWRKTLKWITIGAVSPVGWYNPQTAQTTSLREFHIERVEHWYRRVKYEYISCWVPTHPKYLGFLWDTADWFRNNTIGRPLWHMHHGWPHSALPILLSSFRVFLSLFITSASWTLLLWRLP